MKMMVKRFMPLWITGLLVIIVAAFLSCYFNPIYPDAPDSKTNMTLACENGDSIDIYCITIWSDDGDLETVRYFHIADGKLLGLTIPENRVVHIKIEGYISGVLKREKELTVCVDNGVDTTLAIALAPVADPVPDVPTNVFLQLQPDNSVTITWNSTEHTDDYQIYRSEIESEEGVVVGTCSSATAWCDSTVCAEKTYYYGVKARNASGASQLSNRRSITIPSVSMLPDAPQNLSADSVGTTVVSLTWRRVSAASSYTIYRITGSGSPVDNIALTTMPSYTDRSLASESMYTYAVSAVNSVGESAKSTKLTVTTMAPLPDIPRTIIAEALSEASIRVSWDAADNAAEYELYQSRQEHDGFTRETTTGNLSFAISGLQPNTGYYFKLRALNSAGSSGFSSIVSAKTLEKTNLKPQIPSGLSAQSLSASVIHVCWEKTAAAATYNLYRSTSAAGTYTKIIATADTTVTDTGLSDNTTYYYTISAVNNAGESDRSGPVSATTLIFINTPTGLKAQATAPDRITLQWDSVSGATGYMLFRSLTANGTYTNIGTCSTTSYVDSGLTVNTSYYYKISATGASGESDQSATVSATTPVPVPDTPKGLAATAQSATAILVRFNPVSNATGYTLYSSAGATGVFSKLTALGSTSYTHTGLTADTDYYYKVSASNDAGESALSDAVSARTEQGAVPDAPTGVTATALSSSQIKVKYNAVTGADGYKLFYCSSSNGTYSQWGTTTALADTHTNLAASTTYYYKVKAYNANGESAFSTAASAKTNGTKKVAHITSACNGCGRCVTNFSCPQGAFYSSGGKQVIDPAKCTGCGDCMTKFICPRNAIELIDAAVRAAKDVWQERVPENTVEP